MFSLAVQWFSFDSINLNFFVTGHSQNENDTIHALVERDAQKLNTYILDQWETVIMNALTKNSENTQDKVKMTVINYSNVKDFKFAQHHPLYSKIFKSTYKENGNPEKWSKIMHARFTPHDQQRMLFKYMFFYTSLAGALKLSLIFTINCIFHYFNVLVKVMVVGWNEILVTEFL